MPLSKLALFLAVYALIFLARRSLGAFLAITATLLAVFAQLRWGFTPPLPGSVVSLFAVFVLIAAFLYITSSSTLYTEFTAPFRKLVLSRSRQPLVVAILVVVPLLVGWRAWKSYQPDTAAPAAFRVIHPAPPGSITVHGKTIDLKIGQNPLRALEEDDPEAFAGHLAEGRRVYYENCYFCHGDELDGQGHFYRGLNPRPISFADKSTIAMFSETFLFWRIAKGGPGLPAAATPWDSAMPAWEDFLTNDEMWQVILYVYARTDQRPRAVSGEAR